MVVVTASRGRVAQLVVLALVGGGLIVAERLAPSVGNQAADPLLFALGAVLVGYVLVAAVWELVLVGAKLVATRAT